MKVSISFQNFDHTENLDEKIKEKTAKLNKYYEADTHIHWHCYIRDGSHYAEVKIDNIFAKAQSETLYKTIDLVLKKAEKQINKKNEKLKNKIHRKTEEATILDINDAWNDYDEDYYKDVA